VTDPARLVVWLRATLDAVQRAAEATTPVPVAGEWAAVRDKHAADDAPLTIIQGQNEDDPDYENYSSNVPVIAHAAEWQDEAEANLRFIALNDPAAVLRRIAADRKLLDLHRDDGGDCAVCADPLEASDDSEGSREWSRSAQRFPCATVRLLAEGWTEDTPTGE